MGRFMFDGGEYSLCSASDESKTCESDDVSIYDNCSLMW